VSRNRGSGAQPEKVRFTARLRPWRVEQPSMARLLARMERDGLVRRDTDPADGCSSLISLTDHAMALLAPGRLILSKGNREAVAGFKKSEIDLLVSMLQRVIGNLTGDGAC
jgi:DNA-binding MarR family transcriptional regulator